MFFREQLRLESKTQKERVYYVRYRIGGKDTNPIEEVVGRESERMTAFKASQIRADRARGKEPTNSQRREAIRKEKTVITVKSLWEHYRDSRPKSRSLNTDTSFYSGYIKDSLGGKKPMELCTADVGKLAKSMREQGKAAQSIKHVLSLLRRLLRYGVIHGLCEMPSQSQLHFEMPRIDNKKTENMTQDQLKKYFEVLAEYPNRQAANFLFLALVTGIRHTALASLEWRDIDLEKGFITLRGETAKKKKTERIPIPPQAFAVLEEMDKSCPFLFHNMDGKPFRAAEAFRKEARDIRDTVGLSPEFRPVHGLRHTFASWLASSGQVDLYTLQKLLTHESPDMTARYAHLTDDALRRAAAVTQDVFGQSAAMVKNQKA